MTQEERIKKLLQACEGIPDEVLEQIPQNGIRHFLFNSHLEEFRNKAAQMIARIQGAGSGINLVQLPEELMNPKESVIWELIINYMKAAKSIGKRFEKQQKQADINIRMTKNRNSS